MVQKVIEYFGLRSECLLGCFRINAFGWFNEEHGGHLHEYHVPRTPRIMWGVRVYGSLYEVHEVY